MSQSTALIAAAIAFFKEELASIPAQQQADISAIIVGSSSIGHADTHSDVDGKIICWKPLRLKSRSTIVNGHKIAFEVTTIDEFGIDPLIREGVWNALSPFGLFAVSRALIVHDPGKRFTRIQKKVNRYYPALVWKKLIRSSWRSLLEDGAYNLKRDVKRDKEYMSYLHASNAIWHAIILCFLLNKRYYPTHHQWLYAEFERLPLLAKRIRPSILQVIRTRDGKRRHENVQRMIRILRTHLKKHRLMDENLLDKWWLIPWR